MKSNYVKSTSGTNTKSHSISISPESFDMCQNNKVGKGSFIEKKKIQNYE